MRFMRNLKIRRTTIFFSLSWHFWRLQFFTVFKPYRLRLRQIWTVFLLSKFMKITSSKLSANSEKYRAFTNLPFRKTFCRHHRISLFREYIWLMQQIHLLPIKLSHRWKMFSNSWVFCVGLWMNLPSVEK